jgi:hypothetical protein
MLGFDNPLPANNSDNRSVCSSARASAEHTCPVAQSSGKLLPRFVSSDITAGARAPITLVMMRTSSSPTSRISFSGTVPP